MKYDISPQDLLLQDAKRLDVCNDAKNMMESKIPKISASCLYCKWFASLYGGSCDTLGVCFNDKSTALFKSLVPGWHTCNHYSFGRYPIRKEEGADNG